MLYILVILVDGDGVAGHTQCDICVLSGVVEGRTYRAEQIPIDYITSIETRCGVEFAKIMFAGESALWCGVGRCVSGRVVSLL